MSNSEWRTEKKAATRRLIRERALELFERQGYDNTTVEEIVASAGVSHMTFFRNFPTKEDVVLSDEYDALILEQLQQTSPDLSVVERIRSAFKTGLAEMYELDHDALFIQNKLIAETPALRACLWEDQLIAQQFFVDALRKDVSVTQAYELRVIVAACLAAAATAILTWVEDNGKTQLPTLLDDAFETLTHIEGDLA